MRTATKEKIIAALKRAAHTMAQTAIGVIGTAAMLEEVNWISVLSATALAGLVSVLKSVVIGVPEVNTAVTEDDESTTTDFDGENGV